MRVRPTTWWSCSSNSPIATACGSSASCVGREDHREGHALRLEAARSPRPCVRLAALRVAQVHDRLHHLAVLAALADRRDPRVVVAVDVERPAHARRSRRRTSASRCPTRRRSASAGSRRRTTSSASRRTSSSTSLPAESAQRNDTTASVIDSSRCWPPAPFARANSAAVIAWLAYSAVTLSAAVCRRNTGTPVVGIGLVGGEPAVGLDHGVVGAAVAVRTLGAEPGERRVDDVGVDGPDVVVAEAEPVHHARAGSSGSPRRTSAASRSTISTPSGCCRSSAIERFPRLHTRKKRAHAVDRDADPARDVADAGPFDLHHLGALVGEERGRVRTGERDREVEDADALQRAGSGGHATNSATRSARSTRSTAGSLRPHGRIPAVNTQ